MKRFLALALVSFAAFAGCASERPGRRVLPDGSYQLACEGALADCLTALTDVCRANGYDVIRAKEERKRYGVEPVQSEVTQSEAIVRCRKADALIGGEPQPAASAHAAPVTAATRCFPGTTQACLGPAACKGAQTCREDGVMFGPCDCGGAGPVATPAGGEAGPPPTWAVPAADAGAPQPSP